MADRLLPLSKEITPLRFNEPVQTIESWTTNCRTGHQPCRIQGNRIASKLLEEAQIACVQPANVINAVPHHAEALNPQTSGKTAVPLWI